MSEAEVLLARVEQLVAANMTLQLSVARMREEKSRLVRRHVEHKALIKQLEGDLAVAEQACPLECDKCHDGDDCTCFFCVDLDEEVTGAAGDPG